MAHNLHLVDSSMINKSNDALHKSSVKQDVYQKIHYIHNQDVYPLPTHLTRVFEILDGLITHLTHSVNKNSEGK